MIELNVIVPDYETAQKVYALLGGAAAASAGKPAAASKPADKPAAAKAEDKPATTAAADTGGQSIDDKRKEATRLLQEINKKNGIEAVRAALGEFGVANISAVADDKLDEVIAAFGDKIA